MQYGEVPGIGKPVSRLVQGTVMINSAKFDEGCALLDAVLGLGCNTFDTAHVYGGGDNERSVGRWVNDRGVREQVVIIGKGAHHNGDRKRVTPFDIAADIHDSLARFGFDYIDLYLLHRDDPGVPVGPIVEALNEHLRAGRIRAFGGSNWATERIAAANQYATEHDLVPFVASSPHFSLADMAEAPWDGCISISANSAAAERDWYARENIAIFPWSSLSGGFFSGRLTPENRDDPAHQDTLYTRCYGTPENYARLARAAELARAKGVTVPRIALAWVLAHPLRPHPLVAPNTPAEAADNVAALDLELTPEECRWLRDGD
jgi:aryl-alcohol dehydrogenase-like predicted oxidoreductase